MAKNTNNTSAEHIIIFVEGDTDEVFFKALLDYYRSVSLTELKHCEVCNLKGVTRYTSKLLAKLKNEVLPAARKNNIRIQTVCCSYDTDVFEVRNPLMVNWDSIRKSIQKMGVENFIRIGVHSCIEDWILDDMEGICTYLKMKNVPKSLKGTNGNAKLCNLYAKAERNYNKGYSAQQMINSLNFGKIRSKHLLVLSKLEESLGVQYDENGHDS